MNERYRAEGNMVRRGSDTILHVAWIGERGEAIASSIAAAMNATDKACSHDKLLQDARTLLHEGAVKLEIALTALDRATVEIATLREGLGRIADESTKDEQTGATLVRWARIARHALDTARTAPVPEPTSSDLDESHALRFRYRDHRDKIAERRVYPVSIWYGRTKYHPDPQWLFDAWDFDKAAYRTFAVANVLPRPVLDAELIEAAEDACSSISPPFKAMIDTTEHNSAAIRFHEAMDRLRAAVAAARAQQPAPPGVREAAGDAIDTLRSCATKIALTAPWMAKDAIKVADALRAAMAAEGDKPRWSNLDECCQLHEAIRLIYVVDGFQASLETDDGDRDVATARGESIEAALSALDSALEGKTLENVRGGESTPAPLADASEGGAS